MTCKSCGSEKQDKFGAEVAIHLSINKPLVFIFPELLVCLYCGKAELAEGFVVPQDELRLLAKRDAASGLNPTLT